ncbi:CLUMA_CG007982, isoform A [Clunio marinus]|uniref:CLUMA_CG007982, isoform A n=1 Tax=Clunio marinus TaxID=568069 RepID=A0A1J1I4G3_9DIPT|nr:CLUMA_CG007982, isoform A [Clunio marinus]
MFIPSETCAELFFLTFFLINAAKGFQKTEGKCGCLITTGWKINKLKPPPTSNLVPKCVTQALTKRDITFRCHLNFLHFYILQMLSLNRKWIISSTNVSQNDPLKLFLELILFFKNVAIVKRNINETYAIMFLVWNENLYQIEINDEVLFEFSFTMGLNFTFYLFTQILKEKIDFHPNETKQSQPTQRRNQQNIQPKIGYSDLNFTSNNSHLLL